MEDHTDYIEFERSEGRMIRIVFEIYRGEVLFYHYEYKHNAESNWKTMDKGEDNIYTYQVENEGGDIQAFNLEYPSPNEMKIAHETIAQRYYGYSV